jgi:hypothetical protein
MNPKVKIALKITALVLLPLVVTVPAIAGYKYYKKRKKDKELREGLQD